MPIEVKLLFEALKLIKKNKTLFISILFLAIIIPLFIVMLIPTVLMSWMGWFDDHDDNLIPYQQLSTEIGVMWQELLAIDLAKHNMDQDDLDAKALKDDFVYYIEEAVYKTDKDGNSVYDHTEKIQQVRTFDDVIQYLHFSDEQREEAEEARDNLISEDSDSGIIGNGTVNGDVMSFEPLVRQEAKKNHIEDYVNVLLAMIMQESKGQVLDVMQASESQGLPPNTITDPALSIQIGVAYFADMLTQAGGDVKLALQAYNFGPGFIYYAKQHGGYSQENASTYSSLMGQGKGYGDPEYVSHVMRYVNGAGNGASYYEKALTVMKQFDGWPYLYGGRSPAQHGFDCSGLLEYAFSQVGVNLSGTAAQMYAKTTAISDSQAQPGDLVFFDTDRELTAAEKRDLSLLDAVPFDISHVGLYMGNNNFYNSNNNGVEQSNLTTWKGLYRFLGFRRIQ